MRIVDVWLADSCFLFDSAANPVNIAPVAKRGARWLKWVCRCMSFDSIVSQGQGVGMMREE